MTPDRRTCEEVIRGRQCGRPAAWAVGIAEDGTYLACGQHSRAWAPDCRSPLDPRTPVQRAIVTVITAYTDQLEFLTPSEADVLRDVLACRLARDYAVALGELDELKEWAA